MNGDKQFRKYSLSSIQIVKGLIDKTPFLYSCVEALAIKAGIKQDLLQAGFREQYGEPVGKYWSKVKMDAAGDMLDEGHLSIAEVAHKCHITPNSFSRKFVKEKKMTPTRWQQRIR